MSAVGAPDKLPALLTRGGEAHAAGRLDEAEALARRALAVAPDSGAARHLLAACRLGVGAIDEGAALLREVLASQPDHDEARLHLAMAEAALGRHAAVVDLLAPLVRRRPEVLEAYRPLAAAQWELADRDGAIATYERLVGRQPADAMAQWALGDALRQSGAPDRAVKLLRAARDLLQRDGHAGVGAALMRVHLSLAEALSEMARAAPSGGAEDEAALAARAALALGADDPASLTRIGMVLLGAGDLAGAGAVLGGIDLDHPHADAAAVLIGLATVRSRLQEHAAAQDACRAVLARQPGHVTAHVALALLDLLRGDFAAGWRGYEWRRLMLPQLPQPQDPNAAPWIAPAAFAGRTVRLVAEQGNGDVLQFIRYAGLLAARGARVEVAAGSHPGLVPLLAETAGVAALVERADSEPPADVVVPLLSLPLAFGTDIGTIPANTPYLAVPPERRVTWRARLDQCRAPDDARPRVGVVWSGSPSFGNDRLRSIPLARFRRLLARDDVAFHVLADRLREGDAALLGDLATVHPQIGDFADTAALVEAMDLVIAVDTSVAHLAGALGRPVWVLLPQEPDWRWLLGRDDTPWYPSARLFRQRAYRDWDGVLAQVGEALDVEFG